MKAVNAMTQEEADVASLIDTTVHAAITDSMRFSSRSQWANANKIGVSDIGGCREYVRRTIIDEEFTDEQKDFAAAFVGTAVGDYAEQALLAYTAQHHPEWQVEVQLSIVVRLVIYGYEFRLPGHPDALIIEPDRHTVVDFKSKDKLGTVRRSGPEAKQKYQVSLYTKALIDDGTIDKDKAWCVLTFIDRSGSEAEPQSFAWKYDESIVTEAEQWMEDVIYAVQHDEETSRDMPRPWCWECCPRATACRGLDTDASGLIEDQHVIDAVSVYKEANASIKQLEKDKDSAKSVLANISGSTGEWVVRWIEIGASTIPAQERAGYKRLDIRAVPKSRPRRRQQQPEATGE